MIIVVGKNHQRLVGFGFIGGHHAVGNNDDDVADLRAPGGCPVETNNAGTAFTLDHVGDQTFAIVVVDNMDLLIFEQSGRIHQILVDGNAADIIQFSLRYPDPVDLGFHYGNKHSCGDCPV